MRSSCLGVACFSFTTAALACWSVATSAAPGAAPAQRHFVEAMRLFQRGEVASACRTFETSYDEEPAPGTLYNLAICHEKEGHLAEAYREFDELATRAAEQKLVEKAKAVRDRADALAPRLGILHLVHRADARADVSGLTLDGQSLPMDSWRRPVLVDPKKHVLVVQHTNGVAVTRSIDAVAAGQSLTIEMEDPPRVMAAEAAPSAFPTSSIATAPAAPRHQGLRRAAYVTGGIGAALLVAGGVAGIVALSKKSTLDGECPDGHCMSLRTGLTDQSAADTPATLATICFATGGAALATGIVFFLLSPPGTGADHPSAAASRPLLLPLLDAHLAGAAIAGTF